MDEAASDDNRIEQVFLRVLKEIGAGEKSRIVATGSIRGQMERARRGRVVGGFPCYGYDHLVVDREAKPIEIHRLMSLPPSRLRKKHSARWQILDMNGNLLREIIGPPPKQRYDEVVRIPGIPERVHVVNLIFEWSGKHGWGFKKIAAELNRLGISTIRGEPWSKNTVADILKNPAYRGHAVFNRNSSAKVFRIANLPDEHGNDHTRVELGSWEERGKIKRNDKKNWVVAENAHEQIIPADLVALVDRRLELVRKTTGGRGREPAGENPRSNRLVALLGGFVICGRCGRHFRADPWYWKVKDTSTSETLKRSNYSYACGAYLDGGDAACSEFIVRRNILETPIIERVSARLVSAADERAYKNEFRGIVQRAYGTGFEQGRKNELEKRRDGLLANLQNAARTALRLSPENASLVEEEMNGIRSEIKQVEVELEQMQTHSQATVDVEAMVEEMWLKAQDFHRNFERGNPAERQRILKPYLKQITVSPEEGRAKVELYKFPVGAGTADYRGRVAPPTGLIPSSIEYPLIDRFELVVA